MELALRSKRVLRNVAVGARLSGHPPPEPPGDDDDDDDSSSTDKHSDHGQQSTMESDPAASSDASTSSFDDNTEVNFSDLRYYTGDLDDSSDDEDPDPGADEGQDADAGGSEDDDDDDDDDSIGDAPRQARRRVQQLCTLDLTIASGPSLLAKHRKAIPRRGDLLLLSSKPVYNGVSDLKRSVGNGMRCALALVNGHWDAYGGSVSVAVSRGPGCLYEQVVRGGSCYITGIGSTIPDERQYTSLDDFIQRHDGSSFGRLPAVLKQLLQGPDAAPAALEQQRLPLPPAMAQAAEALINRRSLDDSQCQAVMQLLALAVSARDDRGARADLASDELRQRAERRALQRQVVKAIHGPPGTGKSTAIVALLELLLGLECRALVAAPSNKAVQEIATKLLPRLSQGDNAGDGGGPAAADIGLGPRRLGDIVLFASRSKECPEGLQPLWLDRRVTRIKEAQRQWGKAADDLETCLLRPRAFLKELLEQPVAAEAEEVTVTAAGEVVKLQEEAVEDSVAVVEESVAAVGWSVAAVEAQGAEKTAAPELLNEEARWLPAFTDRLEAIETALQDAGGRLEAELPSRYLNETSALGMPVLLDHLRALRQAAGSLAASGRLGQACRALALLASGASFDEGFDPRGGPSEEDIASFLVAGMELLAALEQCGCPDPYSMTWWDEVCIQYAGVLMCTDSFCARTDVQVSFDLPPEIYLKVGRRSWESSFFLLSLKYDQIC